MNDTTIVAIATPVGRGAVGIVRLSGARAFAIAKELCGSLPEPRQAALRRVRDANGRTLDEALLLCFPGPASYTGEDVVEIQAHGSPVLLDDIVATALELGASEARPGEFTERAYLSGRLDLSQAEAVADLIDAASTSAARAAQASLSGDFSARVTVLVEGVMLLRVQVEGAIDFSDEDVDWLAEGAVFTELEALRAALARLRREAQSGARLADGLQVVLAGAPNTGKSTLMNRLCGEALAIVSDQPGTTRDTLRHDFLLDGVPVRLVDTAGLRHTLDEVEAEGVRRSQERIASADVVLLLGDDREGLPQAMQYEVVAAAPEATLLQLYNKCDLSGNAPGPVDADPFRLRLSARENLGMDALYAALRRAAGITDFAAPFSARRRHLRALDAAAAALDEAARRLQTPGMIDTAAEELRRAQLALGEITGASSSEELLGEIFSRFCIGK